MGDTPLDLVAALLAPLEEALAAARAEHTRLVAERDAVRQEIQVETAKLDSLKNVSSMEFIERCIAAGIDKHSLLELRAKVAAAKVPAEETRYGG